MRCVYVLSSIEFSHLCTFMNLPQEITLEILKAHSCYFVFFRCCCCFLLIEFNVFEAMLLSKVHGF